MQSLLISENLLDKGICTRCVKESFGEYLFHLLLILFFIHTQELVSCVVFKDKPQPLKKEPPALPSSSILSNFMPQATKSLLITYAE